jgi:hypothetical protein
MKKSTLKISTVDMNNLNLQSKTSTIDYDFKKSNKSRQKSKSEHYLMYDACQFKLY